MKKTGLIMCMILVVISAGILIALQRNKHTEEVPTVAAPAEEALQRSEIGRIPNEPVQDPHPTLIHYQDSPEEEVEADATEPALPPRLLPEFDSEEVRHANRVAKEGYGKVPAIDLKNTSPQLASVKEALLSGKHPERISIGIAPTKFDRAKFIVDPSSYLNVAEPGRSLAAAAPGPGVTRLKRVGPSYVNTIQNEPVELSLIGEPGMPISITSADNGHFENGLSYATTKADASGNASFTFTPTTGVINQCRISAASPTSSGVAHFIVNVKLPIHTGKN